MYEAVNKNDMAECWWLMPVILVTQEAEIRRIEVQKPNLGKYFERLFLEKTHYKKGLMEWLKV
jgi:hypothetical protein